MRGREAVLLCFLRAGGRQQEVVDSPAVPRFSARACRGDGPVSRGRGRHGAIQDEDGGAKGARWQGPLLAVLACLEIFKFQEARFEYKWNVLPP